MVFRHLGRYVIDGKVDLVCCGVDWALEGNLLTFVSIELTLSLIRSSS